MTDSRASIDTVIAAVAANPGTSAGLAPEAVRAIWRATCEHIRTMLERRRSVFIPNFAHFVVQKHVGHSGTWGERVTWVPVVALLPAFCQAYGLPPNTQTSVLHQGATSPLTVNTAAVAANCSAMVSRHGVANALKDIVREIGAIAASPTGRPLHLDMGFCTILFHGRKLQAARFDASFARALNSDAHARQLVEAGLRPPTAAHQQQQQRLAPSVTPDRRRSVTPRGRSASGSRAPSVTGNAVAPAPRPTAAEAKEPQPNAPIPAMHGGGDIPMAAPNTARVPAPPPAPRPMDREAVTARAGSSSGGAAGHFAATAPSASPRRAAQEAALQRQLGAIAGADASPHRKRTARKLAYRRSRNQAYEDAWELSRAERARLAEEEARRDREAALAVQRQQAEEKAATAAETAQRRAEERRVQQVNLQLAQSRRGTGVPRAERPGDIFDARRNTGRVPADVTTLDRQVAERRAREEHDKAEAAAYGEAAWREQQEQLAEERRRKEEARLERERQQHEYARIVAEKRDAARRQREEEDELARKCTGFEGFGLGGDVFKAQSVQIQRANFEMVKQRAAERERREAAERERLADAVRRIEARDAALREQEVRTKKARQAAMRDTWTAQAADAHAAKQREREERRRWRDVNFLRNESSDDEDDDASAADRVQYVSKRRPMTAASTGTSNAVYGSAVAGHTPRPPSSSPRAVAH